MNFSAIPKDSLVGRLLRLPLKLLPAGLTMPILQGPMRGMRWVVGSGDHGYWLGSYEIGFQRRLAKVLHPGDVFLDIGAHVGYYTLLGARQVGSNGHVYAFEPLARNALFIKRHIEVNRLNNVTFNQMAVSNQAGKVHFGAGISSSTGRIDLTGEFEVQAEKLDNLLDSGSIHPPDVIKIDVEGSEVEVLEGAQRLIQQFHPEIFLATHGSDAHKACVGMLTSADYALEPIDADAVDEAAEIFAHHVKPQ